MSYRNNMHIPIILSTIQSDVARKVLSSLGAYPIVQFAGYGPEDAGNARRNEVLVSAQMKDCDTFQKAISFFLCADLYGTAIARVGWKTEKVAQKYRILDPMLNAEYVENRSVTHFDGPDWTNVDILDFFPQPGVARIQDMAWVIHRYWMDLDAMEAMTLGEDNPEPYFIKGAIKELRRFETSPEGRLTERQNTGRAYGMNEARAAEKFARPIEIKEMIGLVPDDFATDGIKLRFMAMANDKIMVKDDPFPFWHGTISSPLAGVFHAYNPMPDPHYFHGTGMAEVLEKVQVTVNKLASMKLDGLETNADPMWWVSDQLGLTGPMYTKAGKLIQVNGLVDDTMIKQFSPDLRGMEHLYGEIEALTRYGEKGTGIAEDVVQGLGASNRNTAREFLGRQEGAMTRINLGALLAEQAWLEPMANTFRALNRQFLKVPHMVRMMGSGAIINPNTGLPIPPEPTMVDLADINPDYRARAVGASQMLTKSARQQNLLALMQAVNANPVGMQVINWVAFFRDMFQAFDITNLDEIFVSQVPAVNAMAQEQGQDPMAMLGGMGGSETLPRFGEMMGPQMNGATSGIASMEGNGIQ